MDKVTLDNIFKHILDIKRHTKLDFLDSTLKYIEETESDFDEFCAIMKKHKQFTEELKASMTNLHFFKKEPTLEDLF